MLQDMPAENMGMLKNEQSLIISLKQYQNIQEENCYLLRGDLITGRTSGETVLPPVLQKNSSSPRFASCLNFFTCGKRIKLLLSPCLIPQTHRDINTVIFRFKGSLQLPGKLRKGTFLITADILSGFQLCDTGSHSEIIILIWNRNVNKIKTWRYHCPAWMPFSEADSSNMCNWNMSKVLVQEDQQSWF